MSTLDNLHNGHPSTLLRSLPVENERCMGGRVESFPVLQNKRLAPGANSRVDHHRVRRKRKEIKFRLLKRGVAYKEKWITPVAPGASGYALGWLWPISEALKSLIRMERNICFQLSDGVYKRTQITQEGIGSLKFGALDDVDVSYAFENRVLTFVYANMKWVAFCGPPLTDGMGNCREDQLSVRHNWAVKQDSIVNSWTSLCFYIPETKNIVLSEDYTVKMNKSWHGILKMVSEFSPQGIIGLGLPKSTIFSRYVSETLPTASSMS